jgi:hypothetical protein
MARGDVVLRVPTLMVAFEAEQADVKLKIAGPIGVTFPPRLPHEFAPLVAMVIENPHPEVATTKVRIEIARSDGAVLPDSVRDHTIRWSPGFQAGAPAFIYVIDSVTATFGTEGAYTVRVLIDDDPTPRAITSFGVFLTN